MRYPIGGLLCVALLVAACGGGEKTADTSQAAAGGDTTQVAAQPGGAGAEPAEYQRCSTCHQLNGQGVPGAFPPLAGSEYATHAKVDIPISIVLHGLTGPITVHGQQYNGMMMPYGTGAPMSDAEVARVLTYVRSAWGNSASAVTEQDVARVRAATASRTTPLTEADLKAMM